MLRMGRVALTVALALLSACQVQTEVTLTVAEDGGGLVEVVVGLDADAVDRAGDPATLFETEDLAETGWAVSEPVLDGDGFTRVRASRPFGSPSEAVTLLDQIGGEANLFRDVSLDRTDSFTTTTYSFDGIVDLSAGLAAFSDADLTAALDGEPLGESIEAIEERFGAPVDELFSLEVNVALPGEGGTATATPVLGGSPLTMTATSEITDRTSLVWAGVAATAALAALAIVGLRLVEWRRRRRPA